MCNSKEYTWLPLEARKSLPLDQLFFALASFAIFLQDTSVQEIKKLLAVKFGKLEVFPVAARTSASDAGMNQRIFVGRFDRVFQTCFLRKKAIFQQMQICIRVEGIQTQRLSRKLIDLTILSRRIQRDKWRGKSLYLLATDLFHDLL